MAGARGFLVVSLNDPLAGNTGTARRGKFPGGVVLQAHTAAATANPIVPAPVPRELVMQLSQHAGAPATPIVQVGDTVSAGQLIAAPDGFVSAAVHAPASGRVSAIERRPIAHPGGLSAPCIIIDSDAEQQPIAALQTDRDYQHHDPALVRSWVRNAGIVGLGGAVFPASVKLTAEADRQVHTLLLNGAECDPHICCDDMLMREQATDIVEGGRVMLHILQIHECLIAIEEDKPEALSAMRAAVESIGDDRFEVVEVAAIYPQGGEKQLIQTLSGKEVPADGLPLDIGFVCHNVGTAAAVADAVLRGEPLISRIVTVTGNGIARPRNVRALLGTPVTELVRLCGGYTGDAQRLIMGGSMMGFTLVNDAVPVVKATDCVVALEPQELRSADAIMPCIRCGECARACPASLLPQQLYWHSRDPEPGALLRHNLFDCIECGCCDVVCPSHIPLAQSFRHAKSRIRLQDERRTQSDLARQRYEARETRLAKQKQIAAAQRAQRKAATASTQDPQEAVRQAVERARARRKVKSGKAHPDGEQ